ncbi:hypothetical protein ACHAPT_000850 [Fusarium lateritium]
MRPRGESQGQLAAVQEHETDDLVMQAIKRRDENIGGLQVKTDSFLSNLNKLGKVRVSDAKPSCRDEVRRALVAMQTYVEEQLEEVFNKAAESLRNECKSFQKLAGDIEYEVQNRLAEVQAEFEFGQEQQQQQQTGEVSGEPSILPRTGREGGNPSKRSSYSSASGVSAGGFAGFTGFAGIFAGNKPDPGRITGNASQPPPAAKGSAQPSRRQSRTDWSVWDRGRGGDAKVVQEDAKVAEEDVKAESKPEPKIEPKTEQPVKLDDFKTGNYGYLDPAMQSILGASQDLGMEFIKELEEGGIEKWRREDEDTGLQQQLNDVVVELQAQADLVGKHEMTIEGLRKENEGLKVSNKTLKASLEGGGQTRSASVSTAGLGTPIAGPFGRLASVASLPVNSAVGSPGLGDLNWVTAWLPKALHDNTIRLHTAVKRCAEGEANAKKEIVTYGSSTPSRGGRWPATHQHTLAQNRTDFTKTIEFLEEISAYSKKSDNCLADELSGMDLESTTSLDKVPRSESFGSEAETPTLKSYRRYTAVAGRSESHDQDASTSPKDDDTVVPEVPSPRQDSPKKDSPKEDSPKPKEDSPKPKEESPKPKEDSPKPKEDSSKPKEESSKAKEDSPKAKQESPKAKEDKVKEDEPKEDKPKEVKPREDLVRELDDSESATQNMMAAIDSGVIGVWSFLAHLGLVALTHGGAWVRVAKFLFRVCRYMATQVRRVARRVLPIGGDEDEAAPTFPQAPSPSCFITVAYHCAVFVTFQVYMACQRERNIWFEGNGLTRQYMLERSRSDGKWWLIYGVDGRLAVGKSDVANVFKLVYLLGLGTMKHLSDMAYGVN